MNVSEAKEIVGGLSDVGKMPCHGYSIPANKCITGGKLRDVEGSVCYGCYALKGRYFMHQVQNALEKRFQSLDDPRWVDAMVFLINHYNEGYFRWHDSGDLQSLDHLLMIREVAWETPKTVHWLPTREYGIVRKFFSLGFTKPKNLNIRLSAHMINGSLPEWGFKLGCTVSGVTSKEDFTCPAPKQGNNCGDCRACWDPKVKVVTYHKH